MPRRPERRSVLVIGSGPIALRDTAAACRVLKAAGLRVTMVDSDLTTMTTDPEFADSTYLEPIDPGTVEQVIARERPDALLPTVGGQAALDTTIALYESGVLTRYGIELIGTGIDAILAGENPEEFARIVGRAGAEMVPEASVPGWPKFEFELVQDHEDKVAVACSTGESGSLTDRGYRRMCDLAVAVTRAAGVGPGGCTVRFAADPSGGRVVVTGFDARAPGSSALAVQLAVGHTLDDLGFVTAARRPSATGDVLEIDVDALYDGHELYLGGIMERFEAPGDPACVLPPITLGRADLARIRESTRVLAESTGLRGPLNVRYALTPGALSVLEANPREDRTVPFVSRATGVPLAKAAARVLLGARIADLRAEGLLPPTGDGGMLPPDAAVAVKQGEVMAIDSDFGTAYAKALAAASGPLPTKGRVFAAFAARDNRAMIFPVKALADNGFEILAAEGTGAILQYLGVPVTIAREHSIVDLVMAGEIVLVVDTLPGTPRDEIRAAAATRGIPYLTSIQGLTAAVQGIEAVNRGHSSVVSLQEHIDTLWPIRS
ncbi:hypothetical protein BS329_13905 [Amycolatopsis coloradensis]|uniref:Carbamoyl-phosphate synthase (glutamine-hydrolyzing) n=1 Tax=Amycolatopsis coloradensis TaxID=76021 RepID=A0A1R0KUT5_9PSEU|nr:hypothetical protein [Amycolatopsis coloradensis]OLZ52413.1 hypothetical protein BS329_13905 [Amycolatopsis coloradensis]